MSKLIKRISHLNLENESAIVVGELFPGLDEILGHYSSVFLYETDIPKVKGRNIIPRLNFADTKTLPKIDLLAIDEKYILEMGNFIGIAARHKAGIVLRYQYMPSKKVARSLTEHNYQLIDSAKDLHFWKKNKI